MSKKTVRAGCKDVWNAFMVSGARFTANDIPLCPCATTKPPTELISYEQAKHIYKQHLKNGVTDFRSDAYVVSA